MDVIPELLSFLKRKKWQYRQADGENIVIKTCPFCGRDKWKFSIHAKRTTYRCWHCDAKGNLYKLRRELDDIGSVVNAAQGEQSTKKGGGKTLPMKAIEKWNRQLLKSARGLEYCEARGFTLDTIKHFRLGIRKMRGRLWLIIPHISNGVCHNIKARSLPPNEKMFRRHKGGASILFNQDCLGEFESVYITEAETDAMALWQAGVKNVVSLTCGADTFLPEWYDFLVDKEKIVLVMDADAVGQSGARVIARRLGFDKCHNVLLPLHDANDVLIELGGKELAKAVESQDRFEVSGIVPVSDAFLRCKTHAEMGKDGLLTPWESVNRLLGPGWQPGDLIMLSARVKTGKTTWALNQAVHLAGQAIPSMIFCLEMSVERLAEKVGAIIRQKQVEDLSMLDYTVARYMTRKMPLYIVEPEWGTSLKSDHIFQKIRETVKRYGIRFLVFDNLHFMVRSLQYVTTEIGQVTRGFKMLSQELDMTTLLIAQPKKIGSERVIKYDDIKDSSAIPADADQIILLHRNVREVADVSEDVASESDAEVLDPKTLLRIDADRFRGGGEVFLWYDGASATFMEMKDRPQD